MGGWGPQVTIYTSINTGEQVWYFVDILWFCNFLFQNVNINSMNRFMANIKFDSKAHRQTKIIVNKIETKATESSRNVKKISKNNV